MLVSSDTAKLYRGYRDRFVAGPNSQYLGRERPCAGLRMAPYQHRSLVVPLMRWPLVTDLTTPGVALVASSVAVQDPGSGSLERQSILRLHHDDNPIFAATALLNFVAEYVITAQIEPLTLAFRIVSSLQRLGEYSGMGESGKAPFGFVLRSDAIDDDDPNQNFCNRQTGGAMGLDPSVAEYNSMLCLLALALRLLNEADADYRNGADPAWPQDDASKTLRNNMKVAIAERLTRCSGFLLHDTQYVIRRGDAGNTPVGRGSQVFHLAVPFTSLNSQGGGGLGGAPPPLPVQGVRDLFQELADASSDLTTFVAGLLDPWLEAVLSSAETALQEKLPPDDRDNLLGPYLNEVYDQTILPAFRGKLLDWLKARFAMPFQSRLNERLGQNALDPGTTHALAQSAFALFSHFCLSPPPVATIPSRFDFLTMDVSFTTLLGDWVFLDDFGRPDSTDLGIPWEAESGSWQIKSNAVLTSAGRECDRHRA